MVRTTSTIRRFSEAISAGFPSPAEGYEDEPLNLHKWVVRNPAATFFYRVRGCDLENEHIRDGSVLVVDRSVRPRAGKLVVLESEGDFVVTPFIEGSPVIVCGVVICVVTKL